MSRAREAVERASGRRVCYGYAYGRANGCSRHRKSGGGGAMLIRETCAAGHGASRLVAAAETLSRNAMSLAVTRLSRVRPARAGAKGYGTIGAVRPSKVMRCAAVAAADFRRASGCGAWPGVEALWGQYGHGEECGSPEGARCAGVSAKAVMGRQRTSHRENDRGGAGKQQCNNSERRGRQGSECCCSPGAGGLRGQLKDGARCPLPNPAVRGRIASAGCAILNTLYNR